MNEEEKKKKGEEVKEKSDNIGRRKKMKDEGTAKGNWR